MLAIAIFLDDNVRDTMLKVKAIKNVIPIIAVAYCVTDGYKNNNKQQEEIIKLPILRKGLFFVSR
ncbi:hypothetical protein [Myroides injenensis]|uniref:hypothetical protein n=1 Tax=Myroides injenensis TaxID=1183151 RepID=UPI000289AFB0|nr:hypothetical protein [Myroides injenensis]